MNGAELLCRCLEKHNVEYIFGLFGDIQTDFAQAVHRSSIEWIGVHNEKSGGFMADIYARVSRKPGVVFTTLGPGVTNLTSALANATQDRSPLIAISDQVPLGEYRLDTHQFIDTLTAFHPQTGITKDVSIIRDVAEIPEIIGRAFTIAMQEPRGAVHIAIPADLYSVSASKNLSLLPDVKRKVGQKKGTLPKEDILKLLSSQRQGLVIAGGSIERAGATRLFQKIIEYYRLPVLTTFRGKNAIPFEHPQNLGTISRHLSSVLEKMLRLCDYILFIGYDYNEGVKPSLWEGKITATLNIECFDNRVERVFSPPTYIGALSELFLFLLKEKGSRRYKKFPFLQIKKEIVETVHTSLRTRNEERDPRHIIMAVNDIYDKNTTIVCDVGLNKYYAGLLLKGREKNQILFSNGLSSMAFTSGSLGAAIGNPKREVIALTGDGGFLMDSQEILTTSLYGRKVVWIIFNNGGLGLIEQAQVKNGGKPYGVRFHTLSIRELAKSMGAYGIRIDKTSDLPSALGDAKKMQIPVVIDVPVDYSPYTYTGYKGFKRQTLRKK